MTMGLNRFLAALILLGAMSPIIASADSFPSGALAGNLEYSLGYPGDPYHEIPNEVINFWDSNLPTPAPCPVSQNCPLPIAESASAAGGASSWTAEGGSTNALLTATAVAVKTGAGTVYGWDFYNGGVAAAFVQVFDATSVTLGTTPPLQVKWVPANGAWEEKFPVGVSFSNGLMLAATTTATGSTAPAAGIAANVEYK